jgi:hypothetical protein
MLNILLKYKNLERHFLIIYLSQIVACTYALVCVACDAHNKQPLLPFATLKDSLCNGRIFCSLRYNISVFRYFHIIRPVDCSAWTERNIFHTISKLSSAVCVFRLPLLALPSRYLYPLWTLWHSIILGLLLSSVPLTSDSISHVSFTFCHSFHKIES